MRKRRGAVKMTPFYRIAVLLVGGAAVAGCRGDASQDRSITGGLIARSLHDNPA